MDVAEKSELRMVKEEDEHEIKYLSGQLDDTNGNAAIKSPLVFIFRRSIKLTAIQ